MSVTITVHVKSLVQMIDFSKQGRDLDIIDFQALGVFIKSKVHLVYLAIIDTFSGSHRSYIAMPYLRP